ncbi:30S ribosomal protein S20 [Candidatus Margulisiibacteriota bacterium]
MVTRSKSAKKRVKTSQKRRARNLAAKTDIKKAIKSVEKAIAKKSSDLSDLLKKFFSIIDKAVQRGIIHKNTAARKKSRLSIKASKK